MVPLSRSARVVFSIAVASLVAMVLLYAFPPSDRRTLALSADLCWTWAAAFAAVACVAASRRVTTSEQRRAWRWIAAGCASFLAGQMVWNYYDLVRGAPPPYPSLADVGYLGIYACVIGGLRTLVLGQPLRRTDPELVLDNVLVPFVVVALAVLWMILIQMLRRPAFSAATATLVLPSVIALAIGNQVYAVVALRGTYQAGGPLDLTWDTGLLLLAAAAAIAPDYTLHLQRGRSLTHEPSTAARFIALVIGLAAITGMAIVGILRTKPDPNDAVIVAIGMAIVAARVLYSIGVSRRYANILEDEVANQTRSLMSSLGATASAERSLRLLMEAVPDAITVVDRDGHVLDENTAGRTLVSAFPGEKRRAFGWLEGTASRIARENLAAAFDGELRRFEVPYQRPDGSEGTGHVLLAPVREGGRIPKVLALVRDITDQRRAQTQLQQAEKLAAMGQLVSGVAHEINNPAAIISGFAQTLLLDQLTPEQRETVQMMYDEATRIGRITSNLLAFARAGSKERTLVELNEIVRRTFALRSYHLTTLNITVNLELDDANPKAWANSSDMQQMLLNLLGIYEQGQQHLLHVRAVGPGFGVGVVQLEIHRDVERGEMVGAQRKGAAHDLVQVHQRAFLAPGARECQQVRRDAADPSRLVIHHLHRLPLFRRELIEQQRLGESGDDGGRIVDLVGDAAHQLPHGRERLRLLQLCLCTARICDVPHEREHLGNTAAFAHRSEQHVRGAFAAVRPPVGDFEAAQLAVERRAEILARDAHGGPGEPTEGRSGRLGGRSGVHERAARAVLVEHMAVAIHDGDRIGNGFHEQAEVALGRRSSAEGAHERAGLIGDFVFEQPRIAAIDPQRINEPRGGERERHANDQASRQAGLPEGVQQHHRPQQHNGDADQHASGPAQRHHFKDTPTPP